MEDIRQHPAYLCNRIALSVGIGAVALVALATLAYESPYNVVMFSTVVGLVIVLAIVRFYLLPLARTAFALDLMVSGYFIIILLSQWVAIWLYPRDEVSCGTGCLIVISGVLFASTRLLFLASVAMASSWIFFKYLAGVPLPSTMRSIC